MKLVVKRHAHFVLHRLDNVGHKFYDTIRIRSKRWHFAGAFTMFTILGMLAVPEVVHATLAGLDVVTIWSWSITEELL